MADNNDARIIISPRDIDVICARGGAGNHHPGNHAFRQMVKQLRLRYSTSANKQAISRAIVAAIRAKGGKFLQQDKLKTTWYDIGDKEASKKTSQALREGQPKLLERMTQFSVHGEVISTPVENTSLLSVAEPPKANHFATIVPSLSNGAMDCETAASTITAPQIKSSATLVSPTTTPVLNEPQNSPIVSSSQPIHQRPSQKRKAISECTSEGGSEGSSNSEPAMKKQGGPTTVVPTEDYDKEHAYMLLYWVLRMRHAGQPGIYHCMV